MSVAASAPQRLYLIQVGSLATPDRLVSFGCYLIQMSDGTNVLVDSGLPDPSLPTPAGMAQPIRGPDVVQQLATIGVQPADIALLIGTHFDGDHAGNYLAFTRAQLVVQRQQYEVARSGNPRFASVRVQGDQPATRYLLVEGDVEILPGVELIETSGHVLGHQSVLVRLPRTGPVLLAIDAVGVASDFTRDRAASDRDADSAKTVASTHKLLDLAEREHVALTVFHHDGEQWQTLKKLPAYYD